MRKHRHRSTRLLDMCWLVFGLIAAAAFAGRAQAQSYPSPSRTIRVIEIGAEPSPTSPAEFRALIAAEVVKWRTLIEGAKLTKID